MAQEIEQINTQALVNDIAKQDVNKAQNSQKKGQDGAVDPLFLAYLYIFESVQQNRDTVAVQAKELQVNAAQQQNMINQEATLNFNTLKCYTMEKIEHVTAGPNGVTSHTTYKKVKIDITPEKLADFNAKNEQVSAVRGLLADQMGTLQQDAQIKSANINTDQDADQQSISQGASIMQMAGQLAQQISRI